MADKERSWDSAVKTLAYLGLLSAGAYAGVKHFPSITMRRATTALSSRLLPTKGRVEGLLGNFHRIFGSTPGPPAPGWKAARPQDLTLLHEVETAITAFKSDSRITGAAVDDVARSFLSRHATDVPQAVGSAMPLTVQDFMTRNMGMSNLVASIGGDNVNRLRDSIRELVRLPGFRQSLARQGKTVEQFMGRTPVGGFLMNTPEGVLSARGGIRSLLEDVSNIRFPFTQFKPFALLIPDLSPKPGMTFLGPKASKAMFGSSDALFVGGQIYPISSESGQRLLGRPTAGYRLASTRQVGAARAAASRMGLLMPSRPGIAGRQDKSRAQRIAELQMRKLQRRFGVGPGWSGRRSRVENILGRAWGVARGAEPKFLPQTGTPAAGLTPEASFFKRLLGRPVGPVKGPQDLSMVERARLWLGGEIHRPFFEEGKFIGKRVAHMPAVPDTTRVMPKPFGRAGYYALRGGQGASDWLNYQITRPLWLLSEMTGLGMKPGRSPLESIGQIGLKLALPAYVGYQALEYAEYKSNRWLGFGPITGPAYAYTQARVGAQSVLDATGVTQTLRETEEKYPGSIESPVSRGIRAGAAALAGMIGARHLPGKYAKYAALAGGAGLAYLQLAGINKPADELTRVYSGEQDVPVRSGRWWVLGRQPWGGGKIKFWQPSWYHRLQTRPTEVGRYGGRQQARRASLLPTPENWFLLKNLYDPYYLEREHYYDRPYPQTSGLFGDLPLVGPLAERSIGRIIKPVQRREVPVSAGSEGVGDQDYRQALAHGYGPRPERSPTPQSDRLEIMTGETIYRLFDWTGLPGFMIGSLREQLTGKTGWYLDRRAEATSGAMASAQRDYYDRNLGGMLGATEFFRRFVPNDQGYRKINPLENRMPDWLPGKRSVFQADRESFIDFHTGDAFCVSADTMVETDYELKRADQVSRSDLIRTHTGRLMPVRAVSVRRVRSEDDEKCYRVVLQGLTAFSSVFSEEHPLRQVVSRGPGKQPEYKWAEAKSLKPGDRVALPVPAQEQSGGTTVLDLGSFTGRTCTASWVYASKTQEQADIYEYLTPHVGLYWMGSGDPKKWGERRKILTERGWSAKTFENQQASVREGKDPRRVRRRPAVDNDIAYLIGIYTAEGSPRKGGVSLALHADEDEIRQRADLGMQRIFGITGTWHSGQGKGGDYVYNSVIAEEVMPALCGRYSNTKKLPPFVFDLSRDLMIEVLRGLFDGDGSYFCSDGRHRLSLTTISATLAYQCWLLISALGYRATITKWDSPKDGVQTSYHVNVNGKRGQRLAADLGYCGDEIPETKEAYQTFRDGQIILKIKSIDEVEEPVVYGFEVDEDDSFCVAGVATHNTKLEKGEMRLPGSGWEAARRGVDDGTPGMYSALDRFQILADVAPGSQALKHYRRMVQGQVHTGEMSRQDVKRFTQTENQMAESLKSRVGAAGYRYGADEFAEKEVTIADTGLTTFTTHEHPGMRFHLAGVEGRTYALEGASDAHGKLRRRLAELRGKTVSMTYGGFGLTTPAVLGDVNRRAIDAGLGKYKPVDDLDFRAKHGTNLFRQGYEWAVHSTLPGPLGYPRTKLVGQMAPIEEYESFVRTGTWDTGWEKPVDNYLVPWSNQLLGATSGAQLKARRVNEYMDRFKFAKYSALSERAAAMGGAYDANRFADAASETLVSVNPYAPDFYGDVFGALPPTEKPYFAAFAGVTSEKRQEQILNSVPADLAPVYMGVWDRAAGQDGFRSPVLQRYAEQARKVFEQTPEARVAEYFAHQPLPDNDYAGWHPAVDEDTIRVKLAQQEGLDVHQLGMWAPQEIEAEEMAFPAPTDAGELDREMLYEILRRRGYARASIMAGYPGDRSVFQFGRPRSQRWNQAYQNLSLQGAV